MAMSQEEIDAMLTGPNPNDITDDDVAADLADFEQKQREAMARMEQLRTKAQAGVVVRKPVPTPEATAPTPPVAETAAEPPELEEIELPPTTEAVTAEAPAAQPQPAVEEQPEIISQAPQPEETAEPTTAPLISEAAIEEMEEIPTRGPDQTAAISSLSASLETVAEMLESDLQILGALEGLKDTIDRVRNVSQQIDQRIRRLLS